MNTPTNIAILIDYDNFNNELYLEWLYKAIKKTSPKSRVLVNNAFYSNLSDSKLNRKLQKFELTPIMQVNHTGMKNATDIKMTIEAMRLLENECIDTFVIASNDSDFSAVVDYLKFRGRYIIGVSTKDISAQYKKRFDRFIDLNVMINHTNAKETKFNDKNPQINELLTHIEKIIKASNKEYVHLSDIGNILRDIYKKKFNPKNFGYKNGRTAEFFQVRLNKYIECKKDGLVVLIKLRK